MEQTALANKPDLPMAILDNVSESPNKLAIAVIEIVSKYSGRWIKLVEAAVLSAKPNMAPAAARDAGTESTTEAIRVFGIMQVAGNAFGCRVEIVHPTVGRNPEVAAIVFHQILNKVGA